MNASAHWIRTENPPVAFIESVSVKLPNGDVAVSGWDGNHRWQTSIWNSKQEKWSVPAALPVELTPRETPSVTPLLSGELLLFSARSVVSDPAKGTWREVHAPATPRTRPAATLLRDGRVLVSGGENTGHNALASAEIYDPALDRWTPAGAMNQARTGHSSILTASGDVLVVGSDYGHGVPHDGLTSAELWNPATNTWKRLPAPPVHLADPARPNLTKLGSGQILATGFNDGTTFLWDPATQRWKDAGQLKTEHRTPFATTLLSDGRVLLTGGDEPQASQLRSEKCMELSSAATTASGVFCLVMALVIALRLGRRRALWYALGGVTAGALLYLYALITALGAIRG